MLLLNKDILLHNYNFLTPRNKNSISSNKQFLFKQRPEKCLLVSVIYCNAKLGGLKPLWKNKKQKNTILLSDTKLCSAAQLGSTGRWLRLSNTGWEHPRWSLIWLRVDTDCHLGVHLGLLTSVPIRVTSLCDLGFSQLGCWVLGGNISTSVLKQKHKPAVLLKRLSLGMATVSFCSIL